MSNINLSVLIPSTMQSNFWLDFLDACSTELELLKTDLLTPIEDLYNKRDLTTISELQEITKTFGYYPDTSLNGSVSFYKSEIDSISYRIKRKTTYPGYDYIFKSIPITGYVYNVFWDDISMVRALSLTLNWSSSTAYVVDDIVYYNDVLYTAILDGTNQQPDISPTYWSLWSLSPTYSTIDTYLAVYDYSSPFIYMIPEEYYSFFEDEPLTLDDSMFLDDGHYLDTNILKTTTHHLAIEIVPISLMFTVDSTEPYLMTNDYLDYVKYYVDYNRKSTEIPHVGVQLSLVSDTSRFYNNLNGGLTYTVPDLRANLAVTQDWVFTTREESFYYFAAGVGTNTMWGIGETPGKIESLDEEIYEKTISSNESADDGTFYKISTYVPFGSLKDLVLFVGDGIIYQRSGFTKYRNIIPKSFELTYYANNQDHTISDSTGVGTLESDIFVGTVDYDTGEYELNFVNSASENDAFTASGNPSSFSGTLSYNTVQLSTVEVHYSYAGDSRIARSDSAGNITESGGYIASGTVTVAGVISVTFTVTLSITAVEVIYDYDNYGIPTNSYPVKLSYRTEEVVRLREFGIKNDQGVLIAYGTIPPCHIEDRDFHLSLNIFIKK